MSILRRLAAEMLGSALLLAAIIGSGIMGEQLAGGNIAIALLANTVSTGAALLVLILVFGPISGAHFNPCVSLISVWQKTLPWRESLLYIPAQIIGGFIGVASAHVMFNLPLFSLSTHQRSGLSQCWSEFVATFGLILVINACQKNHVKWIPVAVAAYIMSAYWFTASTSFANPAVTLARSLSNTFAGIRFDDVGGFIVAQLLGAICANIVFRWMFKVEPDLPSTM